MKTSNVPNAAAQRAKLREMSTKRSDLFARKKKDCLACIFYRNHKNHWHVQHPEPFKRKTVRNYFGLGPHRRRAVTRQLLGPGLYAFLKIAFSTGEQSTGRSRNYERNSPPGRVKGFACPLSRFFLSLSLWTYFREERKKACMKKRERQRGEEMEEMEDGQRYG